MMGLGRHANRPLQCYLELSARVPVQKEPEKFVKYGDVNVDEGSWYMNHVATERPHIALGRRKSAGAVNH